MCGSVCSYECETMKLEQRNVFVFGCCAAYNSLTFDRGRNNTYIFYLQWLCCNRMTGTLTSSVTFCSEAPPPHQGYKTEVKVSSCNIIEAIAIYLKASLCQNNFTEITSKRCRK